MPFHRGEASTSEKASTSSSANAMMLNPGRQRHAHVNIVPDGREREGNWRGAEERKAKKRNKRVAWASEAVCRPGVLCTDYLVYICYQRVPTE